MAKVYLKKIEGIKTGCHSSLDLSSRKACYFFNEETGDCKKSDKLPSCLSDGNIIYLQVSNYEVAWKELKQIQFDTNILTLKLMQEIEKEKGIK